MNLFQFIFVGITFTFITPFTLFADEACGKYGDEFLHFINKAGDKYTVCGKFEGGNFPISVLSIIQQVKDQKYFYKVVNTYNEPNDIRTFIAVPEGKNNTTLTHSDLLMINIVDIKELPEKKNEVTFRLSTSKDDEMVKRIF